MKKGKRVILIGFDAGILRTVDHFIDDLPNFKRLIQEGSSSEARPSIPADTPTNWTTISTGAYSSTHGIFGFNNDLGRIKGEAPAVELAETFGSTQNKAEYIWEAAERSGKKTILIHYPTAYPRTIKNSIAVGGCGVGSAPWQLAGPAMYSTDERGTVKIEPDGNGKAVFPLLAGKKYGWSAYGQVALDDEKKDIPGKSDFLMRDALTPRPEASIDSSAPEKFRYQLEIITGKVIFKNSKSETLAELIPGKWTGPVYDSLPTEAGETECFYYLKLHEFSEDGKTIRICRSNITESANYTYPAHIAEELREQNCPVQGNLENALTVMKSEYYFDEDWKDLFLIPEICELQAEKLADTSKYLLNNYDWDISYVQVHIPDGLNHTLGAYLHPDAEKYTDKVNIERSFDIFKKTYKAMDKMLGRIWNECKKEQDVLAVVSDHGSVGAWRYACIQGYLKDGGFMKFKAIDSPVFGKRYAVDMQESKVFLSEHIHINLKSKYPEGSVDDGDFEQVRDELIEYLRKFKDPETGENVLSHVIKREDAGYLGIDCDYVGEVVYFLKPGYYPAVTGINFFSPEIYEIIKSPQKIETKPGATHPYHPDIPHGIMSTNAMFFMSGPGIKKNYRKKDSVHLADVVPTISEIAGIVPPSQTDGKIIQDFLEE